MSGNEAFGSQLSELISSSTIVTDEPGDTVFVVNSEEASEIAGFNVRLPDEMPLSYISVADSAAFTMKIDRTKAQSLLDGAGRTDLVLPDTIDGAEISISIPASVRTAFGLCPDPKSEEDSQGDMEVLYPDCIIFSQMTSPLVNVPEGLDMAQLAQIGLEFSGLSSEEAEAFASSVDWTTTLVVPIPRNAATYVDVSVDGVTGKLIEHDSEYSPNYVLLWVKDGIVYAINGLGTDTTRAFEIVDALP